MLALRHLLDGHRLYDDIRIFHGPVYFFAKWLLHGPLRIPLTHDAVRLTAIAFRLATAATSAWVALRLTGSSTLAIVAFSCVTARQVFAVLEPGHPQELIALLIATLPLAASMVERWPRLASTGLGLVVATLVLVKINVGIFAALAVGTSLLAVTTPSRGARWLRTASLAAALLMPWVLLRSRLEQWGSFAMITSGGVAALAPAVLLGDGGLRLADLRRFALGAAGMLVLVVLSVVRTSSLSSLVDCLIVYPHSIARYFTSPPPELRWAIPAAVLGVVGSLLYAREAKSGGRVVEHLAQVTRLLLGAYAVLPNGTASLALAPFAWLVLLPPPSGERPWTRTLPRLVLAWLAVLEPLQIFPVPGSQIMVGTQPSVLLGLVCCGDAAAWLVSLLPAWTRSVVRTATAALVLIAAIGLGRNDAAVWRGAWSRQSPLGFLGMARVRVASPLAESIRALVAHLKSSCPHFVVLPGYQSLYFWIDQPAPTTVLIPHDTRLVSDEDLSGLVAALDAAPGTCLVRCRTAASGQRDARVDALYARSRPSWTVGDCAVFDYQGR